MAARLKERWMRGWMKLGGRIVPRRFAVRMAAWMAPVSYRRVQLAEMTPAGFVSPRARLEHSGLRMGANVFIDDEVQVFQIGEDATVELNDRVHLHRGSRIFTGQDVKIVIGADTHVQPGCYIYAHVSDIVFGRNIEVAASCAFYSYDHGCAAGELIMRQPLESKGPIKVGDGAWLGHGVIVLAGVRIGEGAVIAAGAVVAKDIPDHAIAAGVPARVIGQRTRKPD